MTHGPSSTLPSSVRATRSLQASAKLFSLRPVLRERMAPGEQPVGWGHATPARTDPRELVRILLTGSLPLVGPVLALGEVLSRQRFLVLTTRRLLVLRRDPAALMLGRDAPRVVSLEADIRTARVWCETLGTVGGEERPVRRLRVRVEPAGEQGPENETRMAPGRALPHPIASSEPLPRLAGGDPAEGMYLITALPGTASDRLARGLETIATEPRPADARRAA